MTFNERLNSYIEELHCSAKDLAEASGISPAAISRYRSGERVPDPDGDHLHLLALGMSRLSGNALNEKDVRDELATCITGIAVDHRTLIANLKALIEAVPISNNELARALNFDPSYISRILDNQRRPADLQAFIMGTARYVARRFAHDVPNDRTLNLLGIEHLDQDEEETARAIAAWLGSNYAPAPSPIGGFLEKLDAFNLSDFIRAIKFDEMKVPTTPLQLPLRKTYTGLEQMMESEIDYLKHTVLSKSTEDVIMFSDMPLQEMAADPEFPQKWMYGMALLLKKGLHLHMIPNTGRPLPEMMLGLESWIPMYMTGQISPYYLENMHNDVFLHHLKVAQQISNLRFAAPHLTQAT